MKNCSISWLKSLEGIYYGEEPDPKLKIHVKPTDRTLEEMIEDRLNRGIIDELVVAWKAGTIVKNDNGDFVPRTSGDSLINCSGKSIIHIDKYLERVRRSWDENNLCKENDFVTIYRELLLCNPPKYFGPVYMINLIYFLSKKKWPIYDRFAHKAASAMCKQKKPSEIIINDMPDKRNVKRVNGIYQEYIDMLKCRFGRADIDRSIDRCLWVYGHAKY
ncbi:MAG: hypothetical protein IJ807_02780 [Eubacterium sp.]|nr:hypothetical protein [Eubacterium sp.]